MTILEAPLAEFPATPVTGFSGAPSLTTVARDQPGAGHTLVAPGPGEGDLPGLAVTQHSWLWGQPRLKAEEWTQIRCPNYADDRESEHLGDVHQRCEHPRLGLVPHAPVLRPPLRDIGYRQGETELTTGVAALVAYQVDLHMARRCGRHCRGPCRSRSRGTCPSILLALRASTSSSSRIGSGP